MLCSHHGTSTRACALTDGGPALCGARRARPLPLPLLHCVGDSRALPPQTGVRLSVSAVTPRPRRKMCVDSAAAGLMASTLGLLGLQLPFALLLALQQPTAAAPGQQAPVMGCVHGCQSVKATGRNISFVVRDMILHMCCFVRLLCGILKRKTRERTSDALARARRSYSNWNRAWQHLGPKFAVACPAGAVIRPMGTARVPNHLAMSMRDLSRIIRP